MPLLIWSFFFLSCTQFVQYTDDQYYEEVDANNSSNASIIFSHNINGETHPCGCRQFPLGGLPQAYGVIKSNQEKAPTLYVDTGDTLFESTLVPEIIYKSSVYKAKKIAEALDRLDLKLLTPGDQDFSLGPEFLARIADKAKFKFLISNSSEQLKFKHEKLAHFNINKLNLFFIGITDPTLLRGEYQKLFISPEQAIKTQLQIIHKQFKELKNKKIILLSHSGLDRDKELAKKFPELNWIIGAHSQSFMRYSWDEGKTKIVQVLSRNHHLGLIQIPFNEKKKETYQLVQTTDDTKDLVKNNPMTPWLQDYKTQLDQIYKDQEAGHTTTADITPSPTYISCSQCHQKQVEFWQETAHSLAYTTLIHAKEANNPNCIGCHSLEYGKNTGFTAVKQMQLSEKQEFNSEKYWKEFNSQVKITHPVRKLAKEKRKAYAKQWLSFDKKQKIYQNYANVQCLHCHNQNEEHPFSSSLKMSANDYKSRCISCHTKDQVPNWYQKDGKGLATSLYETYFAKKLKEVSCPKIEK